MTPSRKQGDDDDLQMGHDQDAKMTRVAATPPPKLQLDTEWDAFEHDMQSLLQQKQQ